MFYRVGKAREKQKTRKRQTKATPNLNPSLPPLFLFSLSFPKPKSRQSCLHPVIPSFLSPNQKSRQSCLHSVIPSLSFPKQKSRQSCLHPVIPSLSFPKQKSCQSCLHSVIPSLSFPNQPSRSSLSYPVILSFLFPQTKIPSILSLSCHPVENYLVNPVQKFNTKTQTSKAGSFDRAHILDCPQRYRRQGQSLFVLVSCFFRRPQW